MSRLHVESRLYYKYKDSIHERACQRGGLIHSLLKISVCLRLLRHHNHQKEGHPSL